MSRTYKDSKEVKETRWLGTWPGRSGYGKFWKGKLSKARRRYIKLTLRGIKAKEPVGLEGEVNWKTW